MSRYGWIFDQTHSDLIGKGLAACRIELRQMCKSERSFFRGPAIVLNRGGDEVVPIGCKEPIESRESPIPRIGQSPQSPSPHPMIKHSHHDGWKLGRPAVVSTGQRKAMWLLQHFNWAFGFASRGLARATPIGVGCTDGRWTFRAGSSSTIPLPRNNGNSSIPFQHSILDLIHPFETLQLASGGQDI